MATYKERDGVLTWEESQGPWEVLVTCDLNAPFDGPSEVRVWFSPDLDNPGPDVDAATATDGIPTTLLRAIPLTEIRARARSLRRQEAPAREPAPVPARMTSERDYVLLVAELARVRASGVKSPQAALAARLGIGKATLSERIKRAKQLGLWDGKELTAKAIQMALVDLASQVADEANH
ncbi:hypothetical protein ACODT5_20775 [Streptomyces sp. 5.8]|uniref:hypothetical protein n=1 Tax=Streptomyces sp. 5.8 TaxID=3406571 RepID=UPI003BB4A095